MELEIFKQQIGKCISNSGLSIGVIYYIMKDVMRSIEDQYNAFLSNAAAMTEMEITEEPPVELKQAEIDEEKEK